MGLVDLLRHAITIQQLDGNDVDEHGNPDPSYATRADTVGFMQPISEREQRLQGEVVTATWRCHLFATEIIDSTDRILWNNRRFEVVGISEWQRPGAEHHKTVQLKEIQGGS